MGVFSGLITMDHFWGGRDEGMKMAGMIIVSEERGKERENSSDKGKKKNRRMVRLGLAWLLASVIPQCSYKVIDVRLGFYFFSPSGSR